MRVLLAIFDLRFSLSGASLWKDLLHLRICTYASLMAYHPSVLFVFATQQLTRHGISFINRKGSEAEVTSQGKDILKQLKSIQHFQREIGRRKSRRIQNFVVLVKNVYYLSTFSDSIEMSSMFIHTVWLTLKNLL